MIRVLFLATVPWDSPRQRPQQLVSRLSDCDVTYKSQWTLRYRRGFFAMPYNARAKIVRVIVHKLAFLRHILGWIGYLQIRGDYDIVITQSYQYYPIVKHFTCSIIYDRIDNEDGFSITPFSVQRDLQKLIAISVRTATVKELLEGHAGIVIPNGVDIEVWRKRKLVVYHGTISWWLDTELIAECAKAMPEVNFLLIGPVSCNIDILKLPNVHFIGAVSHETLPLLIQRADCGIIPFKINNLTAMVDPVKLYEYRALELPVLATKFRPIEYLLQVDREEFSISLQEILYSRVVSRAAIDSHINTWEASAKILSEIIHDKTKN